MYKRQLITFGGLGYSVIRDIVVHRGLRGLSLHSRVVIITPLSITLSGAIMFALLEWDCLLYTSRCV